MIRWLIAHQWKASIRSVVAYQNLAARVIIGFLFALLALNVLQLGFFLGRYLEETFPDRDPVFLINGVFLYYFVLSFLARLAFQRTPTQSILPYLLVPVPRHKICHWLLLKSYWSAFNLIPLLFLLPFAVFVVSPHRSPALALLWVVVLCLTELLNSSAVFFLNIAGRFRLGALLPVAAAAGGLLLLELSGWVELAPYSSALFGALTSHYLSPILPAALIGLLYHQSYSRLRSLSYLDQMQSHPTTAVRDRFSFLKGLGVVGNLVSVELKLLLRNKRPRISLGFSLAMPLFGLIFYASSYRLDFYPAPKSPMQIDTGQAGEVPLVFKVESPDIPGGAYVYLTGNHEKLGSWKPDVIALTEESPGTWERTIWLPVGTRLEFKVTLGSWKTERLNPDGTIPEQFRMEVESADQVVIRAERWADPAADKFLLIFGLYLGLLLTGMAMLVYGQFLIGWESQWFEGILTRMSDLETYFRAKYWILIASVVVLYLVCLPLCYFGTEILVLHSVAFLYNVGVNTHLLLFLSPLSRKRFDLSASTFSTQGKSAIQIFVIVPTLLIPMIMFLPFALTGNSLWGMVLLSSLGLGGLVLGKPLLNAEVEQFRRHRYLITEGFRKG